MTSLELLTLHGDARDMTPGERANLMLAYVCLRQMFPSIPLSDFLAASDRVRGATKENRLAPKDALDYRCPTKGSQWPPAKRITIMAEYVDFCDQLPPGEEMSLEAFLAAVLGGEPAAEQESVPEAAPAAVQSLGQPEVVAAPAAVPPAPAAVPPAPAPVEAPVASQPPASLLPPGSAAAEVVMSIGTAMPQVTQLLAVPKPGTAIGDAMLQFFVDHQQYRICLDITNGEPTPFVDIYVRDSSVDNAVVFELPPSRTVPQTSVLRIRPDLVVTLMVT